MREALEYLEKSSSDTQRGAVYTKPEVVEFILDLAGYVPDRPLYQYSLLEPSIGQGDFLIPAIKRLVISWKSKKTKLPLSVLSNALVAVELHIKTYKETQRKVVEFLLAENFSQEDARTLINHWLIQGDFLLVDINKKFDFVIGNPPYVRQELIPDVLVNEYRRRYASLYDRADLYVPFIERSLQLLAANGNLGFICSDRWMKNRYGGPLRKIVSGDFHLRYYIDMVNTPAFHSDVIAYPAIIIIERSKGHVTRIAHRPAIDKQVLSGLSVLFLNKSIPDTQEMVTELQGAVSGSEPWILERTDQLALVRKLESLFPILEDTGCKVGIGVATGADKIFIGNYNELYVEPDRKIKLVTTKDITGGEVSWKGLGVINPFTDEGTLVNLNEYPLLNRFLNKESELIKKRHVANKNPNNWYRTIDRIYPSLATTKKLLIPDIKGEANIVYEDGKFYPHHNLYYITSNSWDLKALQAVLLSGIAKLFISAYSTKMRGDYLRFQAQYLRRIRIPYWSNIPKDIKSELVLAAERNDKIACNKAVFKLYKLTKAEQEAIGAKGI